MADFELEINEICEFLAKREIPDEVIDRFRDEKMDYSAVNGASDEQLTELGPLRRGDLLSLRSFVNEKLRGESRDEKKRKLLDLLKKKVKQKKKKVEETASTAPGPSNQIKDGHRKVQFGWLHYDQQQKRYIGVRLAKGGGTRTVSAKRSSDVHDLIALGKSIFFPGGMSFFGKIEDMTSTLGNFKGDEISFANFTLARYISSHALTTVRLYLMTRSLDKETEGSDTELPEVFEVDRKPLKVNAKKGSHVDANHGGLMGTSAERETIKGRQEREYQESLAADQAKEREKLEIEEASKRQLQLQTARKRRLPPEPAVNEASAVVSVRHVTLGIQRRAFKATDEMGAVYDWIGSLSTKPESFALSGCGLPELLPSLSVMVADKSILNMQETTVMPPYPEDGLSFLGFGNEEDLSNTNVTLPDLWCTMDDFNFSETLPTALMEGDFHAKKNPEISHVTEDSIPSVVNTGGTEDSSPSLANNNASVVSSPGLAYNTATEDSSPGLACNTATEDSSPGLACNTATADSSPGLACNTATEDSSPGLADSNATQGSSPSLANNNATQDSNPSRTTQGGTRHSQTNRGFQFRQIYLSQLLSGTSETETLENVTPTNASHFSEDFGKKTVQVHRTRLKDDLIQLFSCPEITRQVLNVRVIDDHGRLEEGEGPGVLRDVLSTFWQHIFASLTLGYVEKVPSIRHDHQKHEWEAIGRVLLYGLKETGYVPVCLSPVFLASCLHGEETITEADLLLSFKSYITPDEREVLERVLSEDFQADDEDLTEFLSSYKCYRKPKPQNIRSLFAELAHQEIIQKPRYIANCWAPVLGVLKENADFANVESLRQLFLDNKPTAKKVIKALDAKPTSDAEKESLSFLKKFIKSLDAVSLKTFLKFVTGSDVMVLQTISVSFNSVEGIGRTPIAHTCGPTLELPSTYQSYNELAEEFTNILREKASWTFNIV